MMRSQMPISSCISDETTMIERPSRGECRDELVDLFLGADIDAAGRLVDDDDARARVIIILASSSFCWLPPDSWPASISLADGADVELADRPVERDALLRPVDLKPAPEFVQRGERQVDAQILRVSSRPLPLRSSLR